MTEPPKPEAPSCEICGAALGANNKSAKTDHPRCTQHRRETRTNRDTAAYQAAYREANRETRNADGRARKAVRTAAFRSTQPTCGHEGCGRPLWSTNRWGLCVSHRSDHPDWKVFRAVRLYGLTVEDYRARETEQDGRCMVCGSEPAGRDERLLVDHDHRTGQVRDLLCRNCNTGLGMLGDDPALLRAAADYLDRHQVN